MSHASLFDRIGGQATVERLVRTYLEILQTSPHSVQLCQCYHHGFDHYERRMCEYLAGFLGGPTIYMAHHGLPQLREQHQRFAITAQLRDQWYGCMTQAIAREIDDAALRRELEAAFWGVAESLCEG